jgi:hypothetical protein
MKREEHKYFGKSLHMLNEILVKDVSTQYEKVKRKRDATIRLRLQAIKRLSELRCILEEIHFKDQKQDAETCTYYPGPDGFEKTDFIAWYNDEIKKSAKIAKTKKAEVQKNGKNEKTKSDSE